MNAGGPARREETNKDNKQEGRKRRVDVQERERGPRRTPTIGTKHYGELGPAEQLPERYRSPERSSIPKGN